MPGGMKFDVGGPFCTGVEPIDRRSIRMSVLVDGAPPKHTPESNTSTYNVTTHKQHNGHKEQSLSCMELP